MESDGRRARDRVALEARAGTRFSFGGTGGLRALHVGGGGDELLHPGLESRRATRMLPSIGRFLRDTRAGATAITAAAILMMTVGGTALIVDHVWLVNQRDLLKSATDAGAVAATLGLLDVPASMSDEDVEVALQPIAERYVRFNVSGNVPAGARSRVEETLEVSLDVDRAAGLIDVDAKADMGGTLLSRWFLDYAGPPDGIAANAGVGAAISATEIVLAIDVTGSMLDNLEGNRVPGDDSSSRINIVKTAAVDLVDLLAARENATIAVGLVPWNYRVRLDASTRSEWESQNWAIYPTSRTYPRPGRGPGADRLPSEVQTLPAQSTLPRNCRAWAGCLDMRAARFSTALPAADPFVMNFFTAQTSYPDSQYASYACQDYTRTEAQSQRPRWEEPLCYDIDRVPSGQRICGDGDIQVGGPWRVHPQDNCGGAPILPLTPNLSTVRNAITGMRIGGASTYSSAGIAWATRLLAPTWRPVWGHAEHPMEADGEVQKIIVLLTDGEDNHTSNARTHRNQGCTAAKQEDILIFTIAAMDPRNVSQRLARDLGACSSQSDNPNGKFVFVNNATPEALGEAFAEIGRQIMRLRRTH